MNNEPTNNTINAPELQGALYAELMKSYKLAKGMTDAAGKLVYADFYMVDQIDGIDYYSPNDETWGGVVAVSHEHKLAHDTSFFEMDDMASPAPYDDYKIVVVDGVMGCKYEFDKPPVVLDDEFYRNH